MAFIIFYTISGNSMILTSIKPLGFIAAAIADGVTSVNVLLPDNISAHDYFLRPSDVKNIKKAELLIWIGPEMETFLIKSANALPVEKNLIITQIPGIKSFLIKNNDNKKDKYVNNSKLLPYIVNKRDVFNTNYDLKQFNMHLWLSKDIAKKCAIEIHKKLIKTMPQNRLRIISNLKEFELSLEKVDKQINNQLLKVRNKKYFVFHDAYSYFEKQYGLSPLGYFTTNPKLQASAQHLYQIKKMLVENDITCFFTEPQFNAGIITNLCSGTKVRRGILDPLGTGIHLTKDSYMKFLLQLSNQYLNCLNVK